MNGLIRRAELFNKLATVQTLGEAYAVIQGMPEVDAVEVVVKCGCECWRNIVPSNLKAEGVELRFCRAFNEMTPENGFCFKGERKDGEENGKIR